MIEIRGVEADAAEGVKVDSSSQFFAQQDPGVNLKPGDEVLLLVGKPRGPKHEEYGIPLRLTGAKRAGEDEIVLQYGGQLFVCQKIPEFI